MRLNKLMTTNCSIKRAIMKTIQANEILYPELLSTASLLAGGTMKQTDGTVASLPFKLLTFHLKGCELFNSTHSSPLCTVIWDNTCIQQSCTLFKNNIINSVLLVCSCYHWLTGIKSFFFPLNINKVPLKYCLPPFA